MEEMMWTDWTDVVRPRYRDIVVATDLTEFSAAAVQCAAQLAAIHGARILRVIHVHPPDAEAPDGEVTDELRAEIAEAQRALRAQLPAVMPALELPAGASVVQTLASLIKERPADLLILGTRGGGLLRGGVAEGLILRTEVDVLVVGAHSDIRWPGVSTRIVVAVDFSDSSRRGLRTAREVGGGGAVVALHVVEHANHPRHYASTIGSPFERDPGLPGRVRARLAEWAAGDADEIVVAQGDVANTVLAVAESQRAGLIVLGATGLRDLHGFVLGRCPERVARAARVPVLIVR